MEKNRLEAFSDGVLAIIITIMVLELKQPAGDKLADFWELGTTLLSYLLSFMFVAIYWVNHHLIFHNVEKVNLKILWCNIIWLFVMSFIPFVTAWVGTYPTSWAPLSIYFGDMFLASVAFHFMYYFIISGCTEKKKFKLNMRSIISLLVYFLATVLGGFCPIAAFIVVAIVSLWWIIPEKQKNNNLENHQDSSTSNHI